MKLEKDDVFGRDDGVLCDKLSTPHEDLCGAETWVIDDDQRGHISYECERGHEFALLVEAVDQENLFK